MSELRVSSFGEAQALASEFNTASENLQELIAFTERVGSEMQGIWEGAAIENFMANYEEIKAALSKMVPIVAEMKSEADQKLENLIAANQ
jgi:WXG100 family type VII secretion target